MDGVSEKKKKDQGKGYPVCEYHFLSKEKEKEKCP